MNGMHHVGSKKNKDQLKQYFNASVPVHYKPNKDQCDICIGYKVGNIQYNAYQIHKNEEEKGSAFRKKDNVLSLTSNNIVVIYSDLRKVVITRFAIKYMIL